MLEPSKSGIGLDLGGKIKFATADSKKCLLTTGETDYSVQADLYTVAGDVTPFMTVGWKPRAIPSVAMQTARAWARRSISRIPGLP